MLLSQPVLSSCGEWKRHWCYLFLSVYNLGMEVCTERIVNTCLQENYKRGAQPWRYGVPGRAVGTALITKQEYNQSVLRGSLRNAKCENGESFNSGASIDRRI